MEYGSNIQTTWSGYNNAGIAAVAIGCTLSHCASLSLAKALTIMPIVMHAPTLKFLANANTRSREIASLIAMRPDFAQNFNQRFHASLLHSINGIQLLNELGFITFDNTLFKLKDFAVNSNLGKRSQLINTASAEIAALLDSSEEELYLNLRIQL
ncbi:hypothetical protein J2X66_003204 [Pseudomonas sp. 3296]|uniref:hypothetical protein n=1 Tax=Pseudomonas sp. 3296 TaxID=2817753 RepID=UPI0028587B01|nr:hypothetical protein [Pseudomonas sp. 3296]MDR6916335.1 hypothetical protein [Pseudomonas sp. 3296]